jgi:hypothetical protein
MKTTIRATRVARFAFGALVLTLLVPRPATAQDASALGAAIARTCGGSMDPATQGVLAGVVADSLTQDPLPNARVKIVWQSGGDLSANTATVDTDGQGFYAFCGVPGGVMVLLTATLRVSSPARPVLIEAGMLNLENVNLAVSDPTKPGLVVGRVIDDASRAPIEGAEVRVRAEGATVLTNSRGYFILGQRPAGVYQLQISHLAYTDREVPFHVSGNLTQNVEIPLTSEAIELPGITVTAAPTRYRRDLEGLIRRMDLGFGQFITRERLENRPGARLGDLLREVPGVLVFQNGVKSYLEVRGRECQPDVYVDGRPFPLDPALGVNELFSQELEAIEVYKATEVPGEFLSAGFQRPCMAIVIWTRRGT